MLSNITPVSIPTFPGTTTGTQLWVNDNYIGTADMTAQFDYQIQDTSGGILVRGQNALTSDQYSSWGQGSDSSYIIGCIATNLGLTVSS